MNELLLQREQQQNQYQQPQLQNKPQNQELQNKQSLQQNHKPQNQLPQEKQPQNQQSQDQQPLNPQIQTNIHKINTLKINNNKINNNKIKNQKKIIQQIRKSKLKNKNEKSETDDELHMATNITPASVGGNCFLGFQLGPTKLHNPTTHARQDFTGFEGNLLEIKVAIKTLQHKINIKI